MSSKTNIIYIIADQMRWDILSCNGNDFINTPNFQRLASSGVNFTNAYSGNPVCVPARGIMATGCYSHKCMSVDAKNYNGGRIEKKHIAELLKDNGYSTYGIGKAHCLPYKRNPGFDVFEVAEEGRIETYKSKGKIKDQNIKEDYIEYLREKGFYGMQRAHGIGNNDIRAGSSPLPEEHYVDTWSTTRSLELLDKHLDQNSNKPFYLQLGWVKPHAPYDPPSPWDKMYDPLAIPGPQGSFEDLENMNPCSILYRKNYFVDKVSYAAIQYSRAHYFGLISYLDKQLGRVLDYIEEKCLTESTLIVFTSDHGDNLGDHGIFFKSVLTEGSTHIPMLFSLPGKIDSQKVTVPVSQEDILPTICSYADLECPEDVDGVSMKEMLDNNDKIHKPFVISQYGSGDGMTLMLRKADIKYCYSRYEAKEELYDLYKDPYEKNNLAFDTKSSKKLEEMRELMNKWCIENDHEAIFDQNGRLNKSNFDIDEHLRSPADCIGIRPW